MLSILELLFKKYLHKRSGTHYLRNGEPVLLVRHLRKGKPISLIDVGAYNGDFTDAIEKYCGIEIGVLIEPLPEKAHELRRRFHLPKYHVFECVLSCCDGIVPLEINEFQPTSSILRIKRGIPELAGVSLGSGHTIQRDAFTLDGIVSQVGMKEIDLLKLDVQGAEQLVLRGGPESLKSTSMIWIEVSYKPLYEGSCTFFDVYSFLHEHGFRLYEIGDAFRGPSGELLQSDALFICKG
jgi:FkbM family methyltransferase